MPARTRTTESQLGRQPGAPSPCVRMCLCQCVCRRTYRCACLTPSARSLSWSDATLDASPPVPVVHPPEPPERSTPAPAAAAAPPPPPCPAGGCCRCKPAAVLDKVLTVWWRLLRGSSGTPPVVCTWPLRAASCGTDAVPHVADASVPAGTVAAHSRCHCCCRCCGCCCCCGCGCWLCNWPRGAVAAKTRCGAGEPLSSACAVCTPSSDKALCSSCSCMRSSVFVISCASRSTCRLCIRTSFSPKNSLFASS